MDPSQTDTKLVLGVDLDGVVADFYEGLRPIAAEWLGVTVESLTRDVTYGLPEWNLDACGGYEKLHRFAVTERDLFRVLTPIHGAPATLRRLAYQHNIRIRIITHRLFIPYFHEKAIAQTVAWLDHYGVPYWDLCFMKDKAAVGADVYIEDTAKHVLALREAKHEAIVFSNATNRDVPAPRAESWSQVETLVLQYAERLNREAETAKA